MTIAGVNVRAGQLFMVAANIADDGRLANPVLGASSRLAMNSGLTDALALVDLKDRVKQDLRTWGVNAVGLVGTRAYSGLKYKDAYSRIVPICAVMVASAELSVDYEELKTAEIAKVVGVPAANLKSVTLSRFGFEERPTYWTSGLAEAYGAAAALLAKRGPA